PAVATAAAPAAPAVTPAWPPRTEGFASSPSISPNHPPGARHLDGNMLQGRTLVYTHPTNPRHYGDVHLHFKDDRVVATSLGVTTSGYYHVVDDRLCVILPGWTPTCFYVVDGGDPAHAEQVSALFVPGSRVEPLYVQ
ncbi:MAG TPA: hypothetical protein VF457_00465, partial [Burkholderiaceae bacterium]